MLKSKLKGLFSNKKGDGLGLVIAVVLFVIMIVSLMVYNARPVAETVGTSANTANNTIKDQTDKFLKGEGMTGTESTDTDD